MTLHADSPVAHSDGTGRFTTDADQARQAATAALIETAWRCQLQPMGGLSFIDYVALRHDRPVKWVEVIQRSYTLGWFQARGGIWLKRKTYLTLRNLAAVPLSVVWWGGCVVYHLADGLYVADVDTIDPRPCRGFDPRGAANDEGEAMVAVRHLRRLGE